jgi:hypothetical protein
MTQGPEHQAPGSSDDLEARLRALPAGIEPPRDLWPEIAARLDERDTAGRRPRWWAQAAAVVLLVAGSSLLTARLLDRDRAGDETGPVATHAVRGIEAMPAAFGPDAQLGDEYHAARAQLTALLEERLATMPPGTRVKLEANLAELRRAAREINEALDEYPGDPLLEQLLLKTYQDELAVLANVHELTTALDGSRSAAATGTQTRMEL